MHKAIIVASIVAAAATAVAEPAAKPSTSADDLKQVCQKALDCIGRGDVEAFSLLHERTLNRLLEEDWKAAFAFYRRSHESLSEKYGQYIGYELVEERGVNETFRKYVYVEKHEKDVVRWTFVFYRPRDEWKLYEFNFCGGADVVGSLFK